MGIDAWILLAALTLGPAIAVLICACLAGAFRVPVEPMDDAHEPAAKDPPSVLAGKYSEIR